MFLIDEMISITLIKCCEGKGAVRQIGGIWKDHNEVVQLFLRYRCVQIIQSLPLPLPVTPTRTRWMVEVVPIRVWGVLPEASRMARKMLIFCFQLIFLLNPIMTTCMGLTRAVCSTGTFKFLRVSPQFVSGGSTMCLGSCAKPLDVFPRAFTMSFQGCT